MQLFGQEVWMADLNRWQFIMIDPTASQIFWATVIFSSVLCRGGIAGTVLRIPIDYVWRKAGMSDIVLSSGLVCGIAELFGKLGNELHGSSIAKRLYSKPSNKKRSVG